jgi:hypothetical protein
MTMLSGLVTLAGGVAESVSCAVNEKVPAALGVPEILPVLVLSARPVGNEPLARDQVYGCVPPLADSPEEYATPTLPPGSDEVVICSGFAETVRFVLPVTPLSDAEIAVVPGLIPAANPLILMDATVGNDDVHFVWAVIFRVVPLEYVPMAVKDRGAPVPIIWFDGEIAIELSVAPVPLASDVIC